MATLSASSACEVPDNVRNYFVRMRARACADLSDETSTPRDSVPARRAGRHHRPHRRREAGRCARPAVRHRQPRRRQRQHRRGGGANLAAEPFRMATGLDVVHVPYKGTGPAVARILGGQVSFMFASIPSVIGHVPTKLNALAVSSARRSAALPSVPTVSEAGVPGYELVSWFGLAAPAATPPDVVNALSTQAGRVLAEGDFLERLKATGGDPLPMGAAEFHAF